jgi:hypothetical protein
LEQWLAAENLEEGNRRCQRRLAVAVGQAMNRCVIDAAAEGEAAGAEPARNHRISEPTAEVPGEDAWRDRDRIHVISPWAAGARPSLPDGGLGDDGPP